MPRIALGSLPVPRFVLGSVLALAVVGCASSANYPVVHPAWFGLVPAVALVDPPIQPADAPSMPTVPAGEEERGGLSGSRIRQSVSAVIGYSDEMRRQGNQMWGRIAGFPSQSRAADWLAAELDASGLDDVKKQTYKATGDFWWPKSWDVRVVADPAYGELTIDVPLLSAVPVSRSQLDVPLEAAAVYVGDAGEVSTEGVSGKIAIQHTRPATGAYSDRTKVRESSQKLIAAGAVAVITWVEQAGNMHVFDFGQCGGPCFNIGGQDGKFLTDAIKAAKEKGAPEVKLHLALSAEAMTGLSAVNVVGVLPGKSEEAIIVNAHLDSWFDGAGDNADGVGVLVGLARYFSQMKDRPRTLIFVGSGGHHSSGMNGPANVVSMNPELVKRAVMVVNLEHLAQFEIQAVPEWQVKTTEQPKSFGISNMSPYLVNLVKQAAQRYGFVLSAEPTNSVPGDLGGYAPLNVARIQGIHSGPLYHTSGDRLESISSPGLEKAARFYAHVIEQAMTAPKGQINP
jgi:hypothetical protein